MQWNIANAVAHVKDDLIMPSKQRSTGRIDGVVATVMGLGVAQAHESKRPGEVKFMPFVLEL